MAYLDHKQQLSSQLRTGNNLIALATLMLLFSILDMIVGISNRKNQTFIDGTKYYDFPDDN